MDRKDHLNGSIHYIVEGDGLPVVLLHGVASSHFGWKYLIPELVLNGYRPIALDLPGHGESLKPSRKEDYRFARLYPYVLNWMDSLGFVQPYVMVSHSLGSAFSLQYNLDRPDKVAGLVLIDPFYYPQQVASSMKVINYWPALWETALRLAPYNLIKVMNGFEDCKGNSKSQEILSQMAKDYKRASRWIVRIPGSLPDLSTAVASITSPSLVIWGEKDPTLQPDSFSRLVDQLPNASGYAIADCGHNPHLGNPELVNRLVSEFLHQLSG
jgi:3-oxoadipate enol-lactonase